MIKPNGFGSCVRGLLIAQCGANLLLSSLLLSAAAAVGVAVVVAVLTL